MTNLQHQLDGVMHFVDKWFDDDDPRLLEDPVSRANHAREIALKWGEGLEAKLAECQKKITDLEGTIELAVANTKLAMQRICPTARGCSCGQVSYETRR